MTFSLQRPSVSARSILALCAVALVATSLGGCLRSPRNKAPFTLANPSERHPIAVRQGEVVLDLAVNNGASALNQSQRGQLYDFLRDYKAQSTGPVLIRAPSDVARSRAADEVGAAMRRAGVGRGSVRFEPYYAGGDPSAPIQLSYVQFVAKGPDCPDWSENIGRDPLNLPWPDKGCASQQNLAAMVANPEDLLHPRGEMPRSGERRDVVWGKYVNGDPTGSKWSPSGRPLPERATTSDVSIGLGGGG
jgi:pilus assembly protein CpaD